MNATLKQEVYEHVKSKLLNGDLKAGEKFSMLSLARELNMSNMPVREALNQLDAEGLVQRLPHSGYAVRQLSQSEIEQLFEFRELLESHAAASCARSISRRDLGELEDICLQMREVAIEARAEGAGLPSDWHQRLAEADFAFHRTLIRAGGNHWVAKAMSHVDVIAKLFSYKRLPDDASVMWHAARYYRVHMTIVRAIRKGQEQHVRKIMKAHLRYGDPTSMGPRLKFPGERGGYDHA